MSPPARFGGSGLGARWWRFFISCAASWAERLSSARISSARWCGVCV